MPFLLGREVRNVVNTRKSSIQRAGREWRAPDTTAILRVSDLQAFGGRDPTVREGGNGFSDGTQVGLEKVQQIQRAYRP
jgi:hypothetical protein